MKISKFFISIIFLATIVNAQPQKVIGDCTLTFAITGGDAGTNDNLNGATKTLYVKGHETRVDINSTAYSQSIIYDNVTGVAVILKEIGANKFMSTLDALKWKEQNKKYEGMKISITSETKTILGYECKKAIASLKNGNSFIVFFASAIIPSAIENPFQFNDIPGFVLEYQMPGEKGTKINFSAVKINFSPVPASKFQIPNTGYRIL